MQAKKIAALTLGCKVNQQETESILALFKIHGYIKVPFESMADVYIINTCTVTHLGDRKSRQMIRRAVHANSEAVIVVTGCYAQREAEEVIAIPGVDIVIGTKNRNLLPELVEKARQQKGEAINAVCDIMQAHEFEEITSEPAHTGRVRAYLKVQEGCNQFCSYCIIPYTRGPVRSRSLESIIKEAQALTEAGYKEIVLTGIHTAAYGIDNPNGADISDLISELVKIPRLERLRISSADPHEFGEKLLHVIASKEKVCPHFHIPLQSGCDKTLKAMNRPYDTAFYRNLLHELRKLIPGVAITTDVITGFPGENEKDFADGMAFIEEMAFAGMHVFKFSPRTGTPAAGFPEQVSPQKKDERSKKLFSLSKRLWVDYAETYIGQEVTVLVEQKTSSGMWEGHTPQYLQVSFEADKNLRGEIVTVNIRHLKDGFLIGEIRR